jgi:hypothetical protein
MSFSITALDLRHFFPSKYISVRLGPGASDINAPNKPSYGDNTEAEGGITVGVEFIMNAIPSASVISRPVILGGWVVVVVSVAGVEDGRGGIIVDWEMGLIRVVTTPEPIRLDELEPLAGIEGNCGGVIVDWEMGLIAVVTTPGAIRLDELEPLAGIEGNCGGVIVDWEVVLIAVITTPGAIRLDELDQLA